MKTQELLQEVKVSVLATLALIVILCGLYPLVVWGIAQVAFRGRAAAVQLLRHERADFQPAAVSAQLENQRRAD